MENEANGQDIGNVAGDVNETVDAGRVEMTFGGALSALKGGIQVARVGWNANHVLGLQKPDENSANTLPYIFMIIGMDVADKQGKRVPWVCSQTDMLAEDWTVVDAILVEA